MDTTTQGAHDAATNTENTADDQELRTPWRREDYLALVDNIGADKLADSGVAPLVAAARGYRFVSPADVNEVGKLLRLTPRTSASHRDLEKTITEGIGAMMMPRFRPDSIPNNDAVGDPHISVAEFRPAVPIMVPSGKGDGEMKRKKYVGIKNCPPVVDVNPATPPEWLDHTSIVLIAEGVLKGDSALTAQLRASGVSDEELTAIPHTWGEAISKLRELLRSIPDDKTAMVLSTSGVSAWQSNPEWRYIRLARRNVWVAFDGDVASNPNVWKSARSLWRHLSDKKARPMWLRLPDVEREDGEKAQSGVDDFLSRAGDWGDLPGMLVQNLPDPPRSNHERKPRQYDARMNEDLTVTERWDRQGTSPDGSAQYGWTPGEGFIGRVKSRVDRRSASTSEVRSGEMDDAPVESADVEVELKWVDQHDGTEHESLVTGPYKLLAMPPSDWPLTKVGASVPPEVMSLPEWPPDIKWLQGAKSHRGGETKHSELWEHMGWVPTNVPGEMVYILGNQTIGRDGFVDGVAVPGITDDELHGADSYGVAEADNENDIKESIRHVLDVYSKAWTYPSFASVALAAALRPVVPMPCNVPLSLIGPRSTAKSWTAGAIMAFYQPKPNTWGAKSLPGSASDTATSHEISISQTPVWVIDDLAPSPDDRAEKAEAAKLDGVLRRVYNQSGRRRSGTDLKSRKVNIPRAFTMITAENNRFTDSVNSRYVLLEFAKNYLDDQWMQELEYMTANSTEQSQITFEAIKMMASGAFIPEDFPGDVPDRSWKSVISNLRAIYDRNLDYAQQQLSGNRRAAETAADFLMGLAVWQLLCGIHGLEDERQRFEAMEADVVAVVLDHVSAQAKKTPGAAIVSAVHAVLGSNQAHITSVDTPGAPPAPSGMPHSGLVNARLGWAPDGDGGQRPGGQSIGYLINVGDDDPIVLLDYQNAFSISARYNRDLIMPGSTPAQTWKSAWDEGFAAPESEFRRRKKATGGRKLPVVRTKVGNQRIEGIPFRLSTILEGGVSNDEG